MPLQKVDTIFVNLSNGGGNKWKEPFNQATFFNYDTTQPVTVNQNQVIPPAQSIGGVVYPTVMEISLNTEEYNGTYFTFDFHNSASPNLQCVYTQYMNVQFDPS